ncbi:protein GTLF3B-like protein [Dinothrombium tinctorium]|uniref:Protein NATD1 n=1 Tax=Dinothrombium tinctorium TaxID=1965070 RepID=A0A3S3PL98_9ACAR|nr:protein GTLF3B-like protein [Dinothrombium tinctorium]RWS17623.1 protein GTLF3B-like protein [Dinothrombium tinctorium]
MADRLAANFSTDALKAVHNQSANEFYIQLGKDKAVLNYEYLDRNKVELYHTEVPSELQGKGIAKILAKASFSVTAFDFVVDNNLQMKVTCTYLQKYLKDNPNEITEQSIEGKLVTCITEAPESAQRFIRQQSI